jgi:hypothetical protein
VARLRATGHASDRHYERAAERLFERWPDPQDWADGHRPRRRRAQTGDDETELIPLALSLTSVAVVGVVPRPARGDAA